MSRVIDPEEQKRIEKAKRQRAFERSIVPASQIGLGPDLDDVRPLRGAGGYLMRCTEPRGFFDEVDDSTSLLEHVTDELAEKD